MKRGAVSSVVVLSVLLAATLSACTAASPTPPSKRAQNAAEVSPLTCPPAPVTRTPVRGGSAADRMVPFTPTGLLVCHYAPIPEPLQDTIEIGPVQAARTAAELNSYRQSPKGGYACPADSGEAADLYFWNASQRQTVAVDLSGCRIIANGTIARFVDNDTQVFRKSLGLSPQPDPMSTTG